MELEHTRMQTFGDNAHATLYTMVKLPLPLNNEQSACAPLRCFLLKTQQEFNLRIMYACYYQVVESDIDLILNGNVNENRN